MEELTFMLLYLARMRTGFKGYDSWKGYDFIVLDRLEEKGLISQGRNKTRCKSVRIPEESVEKARELLERYGIRDWGGAPATGHKHCQMWHWITTEIQLPICLT